MMKKKPKSKPQPRPNQPQKLSFWEAGSGPLIIAHRGGDGAGVDKENTLGAFAAARELGYKYGETDVILSKDGHVVAVHGSVNFLDSLFRHRHSRRRMQRYKLDKLRKKFGKNIGDLPTLEELLLSQRRMRFFVDPKTEEVLEPLYRVIKRLNAFDRVCVGSFNYARVKRFQQLADNRPVHTSFIIGRAFRVINHNKDMLKAGRLKDIEAVKIHHSLVSQGMVDLIHKHDFRAIVWTANSKIAITNAVKCDVDGIISDRVELLKTAVTKSTN